jgi:hypothetical protein
VGCQTANPVYAKRLATTTEHRGDERQNDQQSPLSKTVINSAMI